MSLITILQPVGPSSSISNLPGAGTPDPLGSLGEYFAEPLGYITQGSMLSSNIVVSPLINNHYDIRSFHATPLTVTRTMADMKFWNAYHFAGLTMTDLATPTVNLKGGSRTPITQAGLDGKLQSALDGSAQINLEFKASAYEEGWIADSNTTMTLTKDSSLRYSDVLDATIPDYSPHILTSQYVDDIWTQWQDPSSTYYIELLLRALPNQTAEATQALTVSGNEITDASRTTATQGDGRTITNYVINGGFETNNVGWTPWQGATLTRDSTHAKYGTWAQKIVTPGVTVGSGGEGNNGTGPGAGTAFVGQIWTGSMWVYSTAGGEQVAIVMQELNSGGGFLTSGQSSFTLVAGWNQIFITRTLSNASVSQVMLALRTVNVIQAITVWMDGVQVELSPTISNYVDNNTGGILTAGVDSSEGIWEGTTNLWTNGGLETNATGWSSNSGTTSVARDTSVAKFGTASLKVTTDATAASTGCRTGGTTFTNGLVYAASCWVNAPNGLAMSMRIFNAAFTTVATTTFTGTGAWQYVTVTYTAIATELHYAAVLRTNSGSADIFYVDGMQIEQKPIATPYVETNGSTASRSAARVQAPASVLNATQSWVAMRVRMGTTPSARSALGSNSPRFFFYGDAFNRCVQIPWTSSYTGSISVNRSNQLSGGNAASASSAVAWSNIGDLITIIAKWDATTVSISINGGAFVTSATTSNSIPTIAASTFDIGSDVGSVHFDGDMFWFACGVGTVSDADAATINSLGNNDPHWYSLPTETQTTLTWSADNSNALIGATMDLNNSYVDFSSDGTGNFSSVDTDSIPFSASLNSLAAGGDTFFRINRNSLVKANLDSLKFIRFRVQGQSTSTWHFRAQSMRMYPVGKFTFGTTEIDTKRFIFSRSLPEAGGSEGSNNFSGIYLETPKRPKNVTHVAKFNSGHTPTGQNNILELYYRFTVADPINFLNNYIKVVMSSSTANTTITVQEFVNNTGGTVHTYTGATLTNELDYYIQTTLVDNQITVAVYNTNGAFLGSQIFTSPTYTLTTVLTRGFIGFQFAPYNYDFFLYYLGVQRQEFGAMVSKNFITYTPVVGATLITNNSVPDNLVAGETYLEAGDAIVSYDASLDLDIMERTGLNWYGGYVSNDFISLGTTQQLRCTADIYPHSGFNSPVEIVLVDQYGSVAFIQNVGQLIPTQWNHIDLPIRVSIAPNEYQLLIRATSFTSSQFNIKNVKLNHYTVGWEANADGSTWVPMLDPATSDLDGISFNTAGTQLAVRAKAFNDDAWVQGYQVIPRYQLPGHKH